MTINNKAEYHTLREGITGGLSIVMHRVNEKGVTKINKFTYEDNKVMSIDTKHFVTHIIGVDFNSLYPSSFSSNYHEFNPYHGGIMYMPGKLLERIDVYDQNGVMNSSLYNKCVDKIINHRNEPNYVFFATVVLECPKNKINELINFPPVFRNFAIKNDEQTIGSYMYNYGKENNISTIDGDDVKLTMALDTMGQAKTFYCYYLWLLLDLGLKIVDIKSLSLYSANRAFKPFVDEFMGKRQEILAGVAHGNEKFYKIAMNGSYGYDGMNTEHFSKIRVCDEDQAYQAIASDTYINGTKIKDNEYLIQRNPKTYRCKTPLQIAFATLDNAKFWYLTFYYKFLVKALDMNRIHFTHGDTDSMYFAVSGDATKGNNQAFDYVVKDKEFYDANVYKFMPRPGIVDRLESIRDEKKILGCAIEKYGDNEISLCPKVYTICNNGEPRAKAIKVKGISLKYNALVYSDYKNIIDDGNIKQGINRNLQMKNGIMSKIAVTKNALTGFNNKMITLSNQSCAPFIHGLSAKDYCVCDVVCNAPIQQFSKEQMFENDMLLAQLVPISNRFRGNMFRTFNCNKHGYNFVQNGVSDKYWQHQTGTVLQVSKVRNFGVIDFDINKQLSAEEREKIYNDIISKIHYYDIVVRTGSGGVHIYCNNDLHVHANKYVKIYSCDKYDIDYFTSYDVLTDNARIMLPGSTSTKGKYTFVQGGFYSHVERRTSAVLNNFGIAYDVQRNIEHEDAGRLLKKQVVKRDIEQADTEEHDDAYEKSLVEQLVGMDIHGDTHSKLDERLSLLPLFSAVKCLSPANQQLALYNIINKCILTDNADKRFDSEWERATAEGSHIKVLEKIARLYGKP